MSNSDISKACTKCKQVKPIDEYFKSGESGRHSWCKECMRQGRRRYYANNSEKRKLKMKQYTNSPEGKKAIKKAIYAAAARYPEKFRARRMLRYAVQTGKVIKPNECETCGSSAKLEGHHPDYSRPLEATWLCRPCHQDLHKFTLRSRGLA